VCEVCLIKTAQMDNPLLKCEDCGIIVHTKCYPLPHVVDDFRCYTCINEVDEDEIVCVMCCCQGGLTFPCTIKSNDPLISDRYSPPPILCTDYMMQLLRRILLLRSSKSTLYQQPIQHNYEYSICSFMGPV
jgi:hypothetical protein